MTVRFPNEEDDRRADLTSQRLWPGPRPKDDAVTAAADGRFAGNPEHFFGGDKRFPKAAHLGSWDALKKANPDSPEKVSHVGPDEVLFATQGNHERTVVATYRHGGDGPHADTPAKVFHHTKTGRKHVINGHHRILADRIHGRATPVLYLGGGTLPDDGSAGDSGAAPAAAEAALDVFGAIKQIKDAWKEALHPRDHNGRFVPKGSHVTLGDGSTGQVIGASKLKNGTVALHVKRDNGTTAIVKADTTTVQSKVPGTSTVRARVIHSSPRVPSADLMKSIKDNGGFTYDPKTGGLMVPGKDSGIAVAVPGTEQIVGNGDVSRQAFAKSVAKVLTAHKTEIAAGAKLGGWYSEDRNAYMVELTDVLPGDNREAAIAEGKKRNQEGIFDIGKNEYIPTGGTGDGKTDVAPDVVSGAPPAVPPAAKKLDTPSSKYGMEFRQQAADNPLIRSLKADDSQWANVPTTDYPLQANKIIATEAMLQSAPINKVVGGEPLRAGYDPKILKTDSGDVVIDGHHRVAMHSALGHQTMPAKVIDARSWVNPKLNEQLGGPGALNDASPEANAVAHQILSQARGAEPNVTETMTRMAKDNGATLAGLDNRLKGQDSLARKLDTKSAAKGLTIPQYGSKIGDALRYTMLADNPSYTKTVNSTLKEFQKQGYTISEVNNTWAPGGTYRGLNTNVVAPDGTEFELQFHTPQSIAVKKSQHPLYAIERDPKKSATDRVAAHQQMLDNAKTIQEPPGASEITMDSLQPPPPAAAPTAEAPNPVGKDYRNMTAAEKLLAVSIMHGSSSPQYKRALKKWGNKASQG